MRVLLVACLLISSFILVKCNKEGDLYLDDKGSGSGDGLGEVDDTENAVSTYSPSIDDEKDGTDDVTEEKEEVEEEVGSGVDPTDATTTTEKARGRGRGGSGRGGSGRRRRPTPDAGSGSEEEEEEEETTTTTTTTSTTSTTTRSSTTQQPTTTLPPDEEEEEEDDSEEQGSGIDLDGEPESGVMDHRTSCQKAKDVSLQTGLLGSLSPDCDTEGKYRPVQCKGSECFCVHPESGEQDLTHRPVNRNHKHKLPCSDHYVAPVQPVEPHIKPEKADKEENSFEENNEIGEPDAKVPAKPDDDHIDNHILPSVKVPYTHEKGDYEETKQKRKDHDGNLLTANPGVFAGIIGGAVVGLLILILLVMFIVYRMRKKDEGSYALDDQRKPPSHPYKKCPQEFYA